MSIRERWARLGPPEILSVALVSSILLALLDVAGDQHLTFFFDLAFITLCTGLAAMGRQLGLLLSALAPPALVITTVIFLAILSADFVGEADHTMAQAIISGILHHGVALFTGFAICLVGAIMATPAQDYANGDVSPAPSRTTMGSLSE